MASVLGLPPGLAGDGWECVKPDRRVKMHLRVEFLLPFIKICLEKFGDKVWSGSLATTENGAGKRCTCGRRNQ
jgi:hypothetical protein